MKRIYVIVLLIINFVQGYAQINDGYTDKLSYRAGEAVTFFIRSGTAQGGTFYLELQLEDKVGNLIFLIPVSIDVPYQPSNPPANAWEAGFQYTPSVTMWNIPASLKSGYYMINDKNNPNNNTRIPIIIKGDNSNNPTTGSEIVIVCPTNTINAYTGSGGHSLYDVFPNHITTVSFRRPQSRVNYGNCDDYFLDWIRTWADNQSPQIRLNFVSDADLENYPNHDGWDEIQYSKLLIIPGHSEYWTRWGRLNFDKFVDAGKNALILSGNTMWVQGIRPTNYILPDNFS